MNGNTAIDYRNPKVIRNMGIDALIDRGDGNYTEERETLFADVTMEGLMDDLKALRLQEVV